MSGLVDQFNNKGENFMNVHLRGAAAGLLALAGLMALPTAEAAAATVGPGDVAAVEQDTAFNLLVVDFMRGVTFGPGTYVASQFNYQFSDLYGKATGTITPIVVAGSVGGGFTPVAVGDGVSFGGATPFQSTAFGGTGAFTLTQETTLYAGVYWDNDGGAFWDRMPVGFGNSAYASFIYFSTDSNATNGPSVPVVGTLLSSTGDQGTFGRTYDFSVDIAPSAVPEPATLPLAALGLVGAAFAARRSRRRQPSA